MKKKKLSPMATFNVRQTQFLYAISLGVLNSINTCGFDCNNPKEREEVLDVLEAFVSNMFQGHIDMVNQDTNIKDKDKV